MNEATENSRHKVSSDAVEILGRVLVGDDPARRAAADKAFEDAVIGQLIYDARTAAGLTQKELAERIGSDQSVISRLESADYEGHTLNMLRRIAAALGKRLDIRFIDAA